VNAHDLTELSAMCDLLDAHALKRPAWWRADRVVEW